MENNEQSINMMMMVDPYLYETLGQFVNRNIVVQTTHNSLQGKLINVFPDHLMVAVDGSEFFVRMHEVIWITMAD